MPKLLHALSHFWQDLKRRNVVRRNTVYAGAAFIILELVSIVESPLNLPEWTMPLVIILLVLGLIISVIVSWIYELSPEGVLEKTKPINEVNNHETPSASSGWKIASYISFAVIIVLVILNIIPRRSRLKKLQYLIKVSLFYPSRI